MESLHEECGVFGVYNHETDLDSAQMGYFALQALQHRGQDGAGMVASSGSPNATIVKNLGLVTEVFSPQDLRALSGKKMLIGHVRYATSGETSLLNTQPLLTRYADGFLSLAHNGHLVNGPALSRSLRDAGVLLQTDMDTEVLAHMIARSTAPTMEEKLLQLMPQVYGSYALVMMTREAIYGVRDPWGIRPLCIGKRGNSYMLASESCAFDIVGGQFVRDVLPGEIITIDENGLHATQGITQAGGGICLFEYVYFARPDSNMDGVSIYQTRLDAGRLLARVATGGSGYRRRRAGFRHCRCTGLRTLESGIPYGDVLVKNRYIGRTFIKPGQQARELAVRLKLSVLKDQVRGKRIVLIDDSIVRGTNVIIFTKMLRDAGAKEIHMRISSPPVKYPCHFGINTPTQRLLIGASKSVEEMRVSMGLDSLVYLPLETLERSIDLKKGFCTACFDGHYPMDIQKCQRKGCLHS